MNQPLGSSAIGWCEGWVSVVNPEVPSSISTDKTKVSSESTF